MSAEPWRGDANVVKLPWRDDVELAVKNASLAFGLLRNDGVVKPHPPVLRALDMVESAVRSAGHKVASDLYRSNYLYRADEWYRSCNGNHPHTKHRLLFM